MEPTTHQKHQAGRHLVVAQAFLHGYNAQTVGPSGLVEVNGHRTEVHVKTKGMWQIGDLGKFEQGTADRVVFVNLSGPVPEYFILEGDQARTTVRREFDEWRASVGGVRPRTPDSKHAGVKAELVEPGRDRWSLFD